MPLFLAQAPGSQPLDCLATGLCGATVDQANPLVSGAMFVALGLVSLGVLRYRRSRGSKRQS
jgi:hypothetical protein